MLLNIHFSWKLFLIDVLIYALLQVIRIWIDMVLPKSLFDPRLPYYQSRTWEQDGKIYEKHFHIHRWKDKLPTVNSLDHFSKKNLQNLTPEYLSEFIFQTCRGESHHVRSILTTSLFIIWNPPELFCIIFVMSFFGHLPYICIQRYNRPRLKKIFYRIQPYGDLAPQEQAPRHI